MKNIEIIFDNGGGATLQDRDNYYIHSYDDMSQLAEDIIDLRDGGDTDKWDGNEFSDYKDVQIRAAEECGDDPDEIDDDDIFLDPSYDDIRDGGYRVFSIADLIDYAKDADLDEISWGNIYDTVVTLQKNDEN